MTEPPSGEPETPLSIRCSNVFLDAQPIIQASYGFKSGKLGALASLAEANRVCVILTDISQREVIAHINQSVNEALSSLKLPSILRLSSDERLVGLQKGWDSASIAREIIDQFLDFLSRCDAVVLDTSGVSLGGVLADYFARRPPFGATEKRKHEFPDAISLAALRKWTSDERNVAVISRDQGVIEACNSTSHLFAFDDLGKYLNELSSENNALAEFIRERVREHLQDFRASIPQDFIDRGFYLVDVWGDVDGVAVTDIAFEDDEIEVLALRRDSATVELPVAITFEAEATYDKPGTGTWDSEDGVLLFQEKATAEIEHTVTLALTVEVLHDGLDDEAFGINTHYLPPGEDIHVPNPEDDGWPYK